MKPSVIAGVALLGVGAAILMAADFWEKKKFTEWSDKEVQKMLTNSPWARAVDIPLAGPSLGGGSRRGRGGMGGGMPGGGMPGGMGGGGMEGEGGGMGGRGMGGGMDVPQAVPTMRVHVRWMSALPMRQAVARMRFGPEAGASAEAARLLNFQEQRYVVSVAGLPGRMAQADLEKFKELAALKIKGKEPLRANLVQGQREDNRVNLYFSFPKARQGGYDITLADKEVEFELKLRAMEISRKFKLKEMVYGGKLEL